MSLARQDESASPDAYRPAYLKVAEEIAALIQKEGFRPGDRLPTELQLSNRFGIGRTVVREAIKVLSATDLVRARRGSGIFVGNGTRTLLPGLINLPAAVDPHEVEKLFEFRVMLEMEAVRRATHRLTVGGLRQMEDAVAVNRAGAELGDVDRFGRGDMSFHALIAEATGNPFLHSTIQQVMRLHAWVLNLILGSTAGSLVVAVEQHQAILDALRQGREDEAAVAMEAHIRTTEQSYQRELKRRLMDGAASS